MSDELTGVLSVGAGPTGLTLARKGEPFRSIDAATEPQRGSRGKGVRPRALEVLSDLGVVDRVMERGRIAMPIQITGLAETWIRALERDEPRSRERQTHSVTKVAR